MPHGDEQGSTDEVKVFKHEEDDEDNLGAEDLNVEDGLTEDKSSLITESETVRTRIQQVSPPRLRPHHAICRDFPVIFRDSSPPRAATCRVLVFLSRPALSLNWFS